MPERPPGRDGNGRPEPRPPALRRSRPEIQCQRCHGINVVLRRVPDNEGADSLGGIDAHAVEEPRASPEVLNESRVSTSVAHRSEPAEPQVVAPTGHGY